MQDHFHILNSIMRRDYSRRSLVKPARPAAITFLAVANIVFGTLGILCACANSVVMVFRASASNDPDPFVQQMGQTWEFLVQNIPGYVPIEVGRSIYYLVISALAIVAGIGLLSLRPWARVLSLVYGLTMIFVQIAYFLFFFAFVTPVLKQQLGGGDGLFDSGITEIGGGAIVLIYAFVLVIVLFQPGVSAEFYRPALRDVADDWDDVEDR